MQSPSPVIRARSFLDARICPSLPLANVNMMGKVYWGLDVALFGVAGNVSGYFVTRRFSHSTATGKEICQGLVGGRDKISRCDTQTSPRAHIDLASLKQLDAAGRSARNGERRLSPA